MPDSTFYTPDRSQIELHIYPTREDKFIFNGLLFVGILLIPSSLLLEWPRYLLTLGGGITIVLANILLLRPLTFAEYHITLSNNGLSFCIKSSTQKEEIFPLSSIESFEQVWEECGKSRYQVMQMSLTDGNRVKIPDSGLSKEERSIFIEECNEFLNRMKNSTDGSTGSEEEAADPQ